MKKLMIAMAVAGAIGFAKADLTPLVGFEGEDVAGNRLDIGNDATWYVDEAQQETQDVHTWVNDTLVKQYESDGEKYEYPDGTSVGDNYLAIDGLDKTLQRRAQTDGTAYNIPEAGIYIDTLVKFTVSEDDPPEAGEGDKLCIWVGITDEGTTNLMVKAGYVSDDSPTIVARDYETGRTFGDDINEWHRLTVKAISGICEGELVGFVVLVDGVEVASPAEKINEVFLQNVAPLEEEFETLYNNGKLFPSIVYALTDATITSIGFQGSGCIDNVQFTEDELFPTPEPVIPTYSLTIPLVEHASAVVTAGGDEVADLTAIPSNTEVVVTWAADDGYRITAGATENITMDGNKTAAEPTVVEDSTPTDDWPEDPTVVAGQTAAEAFGITGDLANVDASAIATWAKANSVTYDNKTEIKPAAFLLNCANTQAAIDEAKEEFKITSITIDAEGNVTISPATGDGYGNGQVKIQGAAAITSPMEWHDKTTGDQFFRAVLEVKPVANE